VFGKDWVRFGAGLEEPKNGQERESRTLGSAINLLLLLRLVCLATLTVALSAQAEPLNCPGNPHGLGISRTIEIDPTGGPRFGVYQYPTSLDLRPMEVVLTFDDGPRPKTTEAVLSALDHHCVKATFFEIGKSIAAYPKLTQEVLDRGQTVGSHSWSHPENLGHLKFEKAKRDIDTGFDVLNEVSGGRAAPFFRYPGLNDSTELNDYLAKRNIAIISCDIATDDWKGIGASKIVARTLQRLERSGKGILLFHDTKRATVAALPVLLDELARRGYHIVNIVPKSQDATIRAVNAP
jgi:peptidoglycan-N-acetylglucosamine deacetylase